MFARSGDGVIHQISLDLYTCPITRRIMRYPVLAADGYHYELLALLRYAEQGRADSPLRAGHGTIFPVNYNPQLKEMLDKLFQSHADRHEDYEEFEGAEITIDDLIDRINQYGSQLLMPPATGRADRADDGRQIHVAIGNKVLYAFFMYAAFNFTLFTILNFYIFGQEDKRSSMISTLNYLETLIATIVMTVIEAKLRISNDDEYGICGGIANQYYSLFKRPIPAQNPVHPAHRLDRRS